MNVGRPKCLFLISRRGTDFSVADSGIVFAQISCGRTLLPVSALLDFLAGFFHGQYSLN